MKFTCDTNVPVDVLRDPSAEEAFRVFLSRFSHLTYLSAVVILELRAGARTPKQVRLLEQEVIQRFSGVNRVFASSADAFSAAGKLLATVATREGWTAEAHPSLVHDALLATSCRESGVTLITHDRVRAIQGPFARLAVRRAVAGSLPITASHPMTPLTRITIDPTAKRPPRSSRRSS